jgi:hypothetical protein
VALGGGDTRCGLLGAGAVADGDVGLIAGTTAPLELVLDVPVVDPEGRLRSGHHAVPDCYVLEANVGPIGEGFAWLARLLHPDEVRPEDRFTAEASTAAVGSAAMLANVGALVANDRAPAFPVGSFALSHMTGTQGRSARASLARSALEGMACAVRANVEQLARVTGRETKRIHLAGGLSRSALFARILAGRHARGGRARGRARGDRPRRRAVRGRRRGRVRGRARGRAPRRARGRDRRAGRGGGGCIRSALPELERSCVRRASRPPRRSRCATRSRSRSQRRRRAGAARPRSIGRRRS